MPNAFCSCFALPLGGGARGGMEGGTRSSDCPKLFLKNRRKTTGTARQNQLNDTSRRGKAAGGPCRESMEATACCVLTEWAGDHYHLPTPASHSPSASSGRGGEVEGGERERHGGEWGIPYRSWPPSLPHPCRSHPLPPPVMKSIPTWHSFNSDTTSAKAETAVCVFASVNRPAHLANKHHTRWVGMTPPLPPTTTTPRVLFQAAKPTPLPSLISSAVRRGGGMSPSPGYHWLGL